MLINKSGTSRYKCLLEPFIYLLIFIIGYGRFLPFPPVPQAVHGFFSLGHILTLLGGITLLTLLLFALLDKISKVKWGLALVIYVCLAFFIPIFQDFNNKSVIWMNAGKSPDNFINPILGMQMLRHKDRANAVGEVMFVFNKEPFYFLSGNPSGYSALIYEPNHRLIEAQTIGELEAFYKKIYNEDWFWYEDIQ